MTRKVDRIISATAFAISMIWSQGPAVADWLEIATAFLPATVETEAPRPPVKPWVAR